jgi:hypothetical protein
VRRCLIDLLARESKDELADYDRWAQSLGQRQGAGVQPADRGAAPDAE